MKRTISKKIIIALLSALVAVCMGFAALLSRPAAQTNAEESYSETWVIKENWKVDSLTGIVFMYIPGEVGIEKKPFQIITITSSTSSMTDGFIKFHEGSINGNNVTTGDELGKISEYTKTDDKTVYKYFSELKKEGTNTTSYSSWFKNFGTITFHEDTSASQHSSLRTWLEKYAVNLANQSIQVWYNGDISQIVGVPFGTTYEQLDTTKAPAKEGYTCIGWSKTQNASTADTGELDYSNSSGVFYIQVYPVYEANAVETPVETVRVSLIDGGVVIDSEVIKKRTALSSDVISRFVSKSSGKKPADGTYSFNGFKKANGDKIDLSNYVFEEDTAIYFSWIRWFEVKFKDGDKILYQNSVREGSTLANVLSITINTEKEGYTFKGWSYEENGELLDLEAETVTENKTLYAVYELDTSTVWYTYTFKDGDKVVFTQKMAEGEVLDSATVNKANNFAQKKGYILKGWSFTNGGSVFFSQHLDVPATSDATFYAVYEKGGTDPTEPDTPDVPETSEYKVVFLVDNLVAYTATVESGKAVSFADYPELSEKIKKDGYTFKGWKIEGQDEIYTDGIPAQNKTTVLVAVYEKNVLGKDSGTKTASIVISVAIGIVGVYFLFKLFGGKRRRR